MAFQAVLIVVDHQVSVEDATEADEAFVTLMGDQVGPRRNFIQSHARTVRNLDV